MGEICYVGAPLDSPIENVKVIDVLKITYLYLPNLRQIDRDIVFTSKRGVISMKMNGTKIKSKKAYTIGHITSQYLEKLYGLKSEFPIEENSESLGNLLISKKGEYTIVSSDSVSGSMIKKLRDDDVSFDIIYTYKIEENENADYSYLEKLDKILVGSSKSFQIIQKRAGDLLENKFFYAIGKPTYNKIKSYGYKKVKYFEVPDIRRIVDQIMTERI